MQPLSLPTDVLTMDPMTSQVFLSPKSSTNLSQVLVFDQGKLRNNFMSKYVSVNLGIVKADPDDTRGASSWKLGKVNGSRSEHQI